MRNFGRFISRGAWPVVGVWIAFVVFSFAFAFGGITGTGLFERLYSGELKVAGQHRDGMDLLTQNGYVSKKTTTITIDGVNLTQTRNQQLGALLVKDLRAIPNVESAINPFVLPQGLQNPQAAMFLAKPTGAETAPPGFATVVTLKPDLSSQQRDAVYEEVNARADKARTDFPDATVRYGGADGLLKAMNSQAEADLQKGEAVALPLSFLVMILVFAGFLAAGIPLFGAIASIAGGMATLAGMTYLVDDVNVMSVNIVTILGLGLCIDYGLLVVSRYREELLALVQAARKPGQTLQEALTQVDRPMRAQAVGETMNTAGRTVAFSGLIVAVSLSGLFFFDIVLFRSVAAAAVTVVFLALAVALSLTPAILTLAGRRILSRRYLASQGLELSASHPDVPSELGVGAETPSATSTVSAGFFLKVARIVQKHPGKILAGTAAFLLVVATPMLNMRLGVTLSEMLPADNPQRQFAQSLSDRFPGMAAPAVSVVVDSPDADLREVSAEITKIPGVRNLGPVQKIGDVQMLPVFSTDGTMSDTAKTVTRKVDELNFPAETHQIGFEQVARDFSAETFRGAVPAVIFVVVMTFILLFLMTGSFVLPVKALLLNVLSLGATFGVLTWIFQDGHLDSWLGFESQGHVDMSLPVIIIAFAFGLSIDYEVFLLGRIVELRRNGYSTNDAVAFGMQQTGRIITSAAVIIAIVFAGFASGHLLATKEVGVALTVAVLVDATVVRMLLVPAAMTLLGKYCWWSPARLEKLGRLLAH